MTVFHKAQIMSRTCLPRVLKEITIFDMLSTYVYRVRIIWNQQSLQAKHYTPQTFWNSGYNYKKIQHAFNTPLPKIIKWCIFHISAVFVHFIQNSYNSFNRVLSTHQGSLPPRKISSLLCPSKASLVLKLPGIHSIPQQMYRDVYQTNLSPLRQC